MNCIMARLWASIVSVSLPVILCLSYSLAEDNKPAVSKQTRPLAEKKVDKGNQE